MNEKFPQFTRSSETLMFNERVLPELPSYYREPGLHNPLILPYGAMPANSFFDQEVKDQQAEIEAEHYGLYETPPKEMPEPFVRVMTADYVINQNRRKMDNYEGFMKWELKGEAVSTDLLVNKDLIIRGQASIDQEVEFATRTTLDAIEFGKVGHPYGYRMQEIIPLRSDMNEAIELHGGVVYPTVSPHRSIKILPKVERYDDGSEYGLQRIVGFIVKYKRDVGRIPVVGSDDVIHVVERQIAAYRVDEASGFDQEVLAKMHALCDKYPLRIRWDQSINASFEDRLVRTGCRDFIENAVQTDSLEDFVVPISTTIYGFKGEHPVFGLVGSVAVGNKPSLDNGMAYFGPTPSSGSCASHDNNS